MRLLDKFKGLIYRPCGTLLAGIGDYPKFQRISVLGHPFSVFEVEIGDSRTIKGIEERIGVVFAEIAIGAPEIVESVLGQVIIPKMPRSHHTTAIPSGFEDIADGHAVRGQVATPFAN